MLYVTTREPRDAYTANRALSENRCPEGGFFVPLRLPHFDAGQIANLAEKSFSQNVADVLNLFFGAKLDGWTVEFHIGRYPVRTVALHSKVTVAETWHNPTYRFERLVCGVFKAISQSDQASHAPADWLLIASRIAVLFGLFGQFLRDGSLAEGQRMDISVPSGDFSALMAVWYARAMGLPVGTIVCCTNENDSLWNLLHKGELRTDAVAPRTHTPECDYTVPSDLERLIFDVFGQSETERFCNVCRTGGTYCLEPEQTQQLRDGIYVSVVSGKKMASTIPNLYKTTGFLADPCSALAYSGLIDYRAATGESRPALILAEQSPVFSAKFVTDCLNITPAELKQILE